MKNKIFYILQGNNGATYFLNTKNWKSISDSLKFYKSRSLKQNILKASLQIYLYILGSFIQKVNLAPLKTRDEITDHLKNMIGEDITFDLDDNCSALTSPTKDKIIIHHHDKYFQKFAFGSSYQKAQNEADIYKLLLDRSLEYFYVSKIYNISKEEYFFSFKMKIKTTNKKKPTIKNPDIESALVELFYSSPLNNSCTLLEYLLELQARHTALETNIDAIHQIIQLLKQQPRKQRIPLGLVHRDFKPWNISYDNNRLLIYDFEEAVIDGPPLEDLFNYYIDPEIRYKTSEDIALMILKPSMIKLYNHYLEKMKLDIDFKTLLYTYLIERAIFWFKENEIETSTNYINLISYFLYETDKT
jgi:hypothetical protein